MRPTFEVADVLRRYLDAYKAKYLLSLVQHKAVQAILNCRTSVLGGHVDCCTSCGQVLEVSYNSCRNRHCPKCQWSAQRRWIGKRMEELLPVTYYHVVFTLPQELNALVRSNDTALYNLLFRTSWQTLDQLCRQPKWLGAQPGMIAVLHTWGQNLSLHPHLHCIVPGGGLALDGNSWVGSRSGYFLPVRVLSRLFRGKFLNQLKRIFAQGDLQFHGQAQALQSAEAFGRLVRQLYGKEWVVYAKRPFGGPQQVIQYLGRYTHRIAISNHRIQHVDTNTHKVSFSCKDYRQGGKTTMACLDAVEFIRRFVQHCLPLGFQKIRYYGILATRNRKDKLAKLQAGLGFTPAKAEPEPAGEEKLNDLCCPACGKSTLRRIIMPASLPPRHRPAQASAAANSNTQRAPPFQATQALVVEP